MIPVPKHIRTITPYVPGKPVEELERELGIKGSIKLASNENPLGPSPYALSALRRGVKDLNRYPEGNCYYLRAALSRKLQISPEELIFGNGSNEIIELAVRTFLSPGEEAIMAHPSFVVYPMVTQAAHGKNIIIPLRNLRHDIKEMASRITKKNRLIFIANPNNPTGTINTKNEMDIFIKKVPKSTLVIIDEAYYEYVTSPDYANSMKYLKQNKNILILRTFSKAYGLAGLRIGYGIANKQVVTEMNKIRQPFNVNTLAQTAADAALNDTKHLTKTLRINEQGKKYLYRELSALDLDYIPTEANFIFIQLKDKKAQKIYDKLLHRGVIVRPLGESSLRITIGRPEENRVLIKELRDIL